MGEGKSVPITGNTRSMYHSSYARPKLWRSMLVQLRVRAKERRSQEALGGRARPRGRQIKGAVRVHQESLIY